MYICRSKILIHVRKKDGLIVVRYMGCHNRNCSHCQGVKAEKYAKILSKTPVMYYKVVPTSDANNLIRSVRYTGDAYWRCELFYGVTAIVTTKQVSEKWIPFPSSDKDDCEAILKGWLSEQSGNISMTRRSDKKDRARDEYVTFSGSADTPMPISDAMSLGNYSQLSHNVYVPCGEPNLSAITESLNVKIVV